MLPVNSTTGQLLDVPDTYTGKSQFLALLLGSAGFITHRTFFSLSWFERA
jgi:hypothetical protein